MIVAWKSGDCWLLVRNVRASDIGSRHDRAPREPGVTTFDSCWSGEAWEADPGRAMTFSARQEALNYLRQNNDRMEDSR